MRNRIVRVIVFFDLPNVYYKDKRNYVLFRKFLQNEGFIMMQESVYSKLCLNSVQCDLIINKIKNNAPKKGLIQSLIITEKQYSSIENITGISENKILDNDDRLVIL